MREEEPIIILAGLTQRHKTDAQLISTLFDKMRMTFVKSEMKTFKETQNDYQHYSSSIMSDLDGSYSVTEISGTY